MPKQPEQILEDNLVQQLIGLGYSKRQMAASEKNDIENISHNLDFERSEKYFG